jgi:hypothetical protein
MKYVEITNDNNILQISDQYQNMVLKKVIGFHSTQKIGPKDNFYEKNGYPVGAYWVKYPNGQSSNVWYARVNITSDINSENLLYVVESSAPIEDFQINEVYGTIESWGKNGLVMSDKGGRRLELYVKFKNTDHQYDGHKYIKIYVYTDNIIHKGENGFEVMNSNGDVLFNSNYRYLQVKDIITKHYDQGDKQYDFPAYQYPSIKKMAVAVLLKASSEGNYAHLQRINIDGNSIYGTYQKNGRGTTYSYIPEQGTIILVADVDNCSDIPVSYDNII